MRLGENRCCVIHKREWISLGRRCVTTSQIFYDSGRVHLHYQTWLGPPIQAIGDHVKNAYLCHQVFSRLLACLGITFPTRRMLNTFAAIARNHRVVSHCHFHCLMLNVCTSSMDLVSTRFAMALWMQSLWHLRFLLLVDPSLPPQLLSCTSAPCLLHPANRLVEHASERDARVQREAMERWRKA